MRCRCPVRRRPRSSMAGRRRPRGVPPTGAAGQGRGPARIGQGRTSHLVTVTGVGAIADLRSMSVIVRGLDAWNPEHQDSIEEPRLLDAVRRVLGPQVRALRYAPWDPSER